MRTWWLLLGTIVALCLPRSALAFTFDDAPGDFHVAIDVESGERLCVAFPEGHADRDACEGYDQSAFGRLGSRPGATPIGVAILRKDASEVFFVAMRGEPAGAIRDLDKDAAANAGGIETGLKGGLGDVKTLRNEHRKRTVAGRDALEGDLDLDIALDAPASSIFGHTRYVVVPVGDVDYTLMFSGPLANAASTNALADRVVATLSAKPPSAQRAERDNGRGGGSGRPIAERIGYYTALVGIPLVVLLLILRSARRRPTPHPYYPPHHWQPPPPQGWSAPPPQQGWSAPPPPQGWSPAPNDPHQSRPPQDPSWQQPQSGHYPQHAAPGPSASNTPPLPVNRGE